MYNDRFSYSRPNFFPPVVKWLLITNVAIFVLGMLPIGTYADGTSRVLDHIFLQYGALWPPSSEFFRPWQYFTTMFLHADVFHLLMNMFVLWMFGSEVENHLGSRRLAIFYLLSGLGASLLHTIFTVIDGSVSPAVGASGAISGVMIAYAMLFPDRIILLFFIPMKARWAAVFYIGYSIFRGVSNSPTDNIAHFAHLGGALTGFILLKTGLDAIIANKLSGKTSPKQPTHYVQQPPAPGPLSRSDRQQSTRIVDARFRDVPSPPPRNAPVNMNFGQDQERINQILDKISDQGYQSLTQDEKDFLNNASKKMES